MKMFIPILLIAHALIWTADPVHADTPDWGQRSSASHKHTDWTDTDWNIIAYSNCKLPDATAIEKASEDGEAFVRFQLRNGDTGGCPSDRRARNHAPYWERAELRLNRYLVRNAEFELTARLRFVQGFKGDRETFLQLHSSYKGCGWPTIMFKMDHGNLMIASKYYAADTKPQTLHDRRVANIRTQHGVWHDIRFRFGTAELSKFSVWWDGQPIIQKRNFVIKDCARPYLKFGIYRPGNTNGAGNAHSIIDYDGLILKRLQ